jgi:ribosomal-protein-alanine N-acetyltransferase
MIPSLQAERVTLSPFSIEDASLVQRYAGDPEIARTTLHIPHPYPDGEAEKWIASHLHQYLERKNVVFAIRSRTGELYGAINIGLQRNNQAGELGYWIGVPYWNKGYGTDAVGRVIRFAFEDLELIRIYARHFGGNIASGRVMEKARMKKERILRQCVMKNGVMMDMVEYAILKSEYNNG